MGGPVPCGVRVDRHAADRILDGSANRGGGVVIVRVGVVMQIHERAPFGQSYAEHRNRLTVFGCAEPAGTQLAI